MWSSRLLLAERHVCIPLVSSRLGAELAVLSPLGAEKVDSDVLALLHLYSLRAPTALIGFLRCLLPELNPSPLLISYIEFRGPQNIPGCERAHVGG